MPNNNYEFASRKVFNCNSSFNFTEDIPCVIELKTNRYISVKHNYVILFRKMTTYFGLRDHLQAIITKILKSSAVHHKLSS